MNKVSVLIPCYNVDKYLTRCVNSILNQTYGNLQIVMIDDGSSDNTWSVMNSLAATNSNIEIYQQKNKGVANTRNHLLSRVEGDYVLFVDADDWIEPEMIEYLVKTIERYGADVSVCGYVINDLEPSKEYEETPLNRTETIKKFLFHKDLKGSLCNKILKTSLLCNLSFDDSIGYGEDALFCWELFKKVNKVVLTKKQLYHYRMNDQSISHSIFGKQKLTGNNVWEKIAEDTQLFYPEFVSIAKARWGMENFYLLRQAGFSEYPKDENIKKLQRNVRRHLPDMRSSGLLHGKEILNAYIMCRWYGYNQFYRILYNLKATIRCL